MGLAAASLEGRRSYERHRPETTTLYAVVQGNVETLYAAVAAGFEGAALPPFVRRELEGYLDCGLLCRGFARLKCESCTEQHLVAFACYPERDTMRSWGPAPGAQAPENTGFK